MPFINQRGREKRLNLSKIYLPLITAGLFAASFAPTQPYMRFFILIVFIPYLFVVFHSKRKIFLIGFVFGLLSNLGILWWISAMYVEDVSHLLIAFGVFLLLLYLSLFWGLVAVLITFLKRISLSLAIFSFPFFWICFEFLRSLTSQIGFPWGTVGYSFAAVPSLIQIASFTGVSGVSFFILLCNSLLYWSFTQRHWTKGILGLVIFVLLFTVNLVSGKAVLSHHAKTREVKVALIQANILPEVKRENEEEERINILRNMTIEAGLTHPSLIVWSETSIPCYYKEHSLCIKKIKEIVKNVGIPVVAGAPEYIHNYKTRKTYIYNSAFLISAFGETIGKYRKIYLVPFGEHLPFDNTLTFLTNVHLGQGDFLPGNSFTVFNQGRFRFSTLICFESIFPRLVRKMVKNGAELLVNITEDSWFGRTPGPYQHAEMAILRAVENRISVARCGNSGISMFVDPYGRVLEKSNIFERTIVDGKIPLRKGFSFYTRFGDVFAWSIVFVSILLIIFSFVILSGRKRD